jgi:hypothetical protein
LGQFSKNCWSFYPKNVQYALKYMGLGSGIRDPRSGIQGSKGTGSRIPDPQHCLLGLLAPLADEVRAEHVKLSWEAPEDDGGTPIIKYIVRLLDLDYNEWINVCEASISSSNCLSQKFSEQLGYVHAVKCEYNGVFLWLRKLKFIRAKRINSQHNHFYLV